MRIAYLCNSFPEPSEAYVGDEIQALRAHSVEVVPCSVRRPSGPLASDRDPLHLFPLSPWICLRATWLCLTGYHLIRDLVAKVIVSFRPAPRRIRALVHTWLGAYLAVRLKTLPPDHIHVHHGYFGAWVGMVAARFLRVGFSLTLHGSDLLLRADYLDVKLNEAQFCFTISEFNRQHIIANYPEVCPDKILVQRLGVDLNFWKPVQADDGRERFSILSVGRLHPVKNHAFLILACRALRVRGTSFECLIAGDGGERRRLQQLITCLGLQNEVKLIGQVSPETLRELYSKANAVVLTSHSEGIPLTLMEAMAMERIVLAPKITGIPELVSHAETGFLYQPNSMEDFFTQLQIVLHGRRMLKRIGAAARRQIEEHFDGPANCEHFAQRFLERVRVQPEPELLSSAECNENPVLQQI